MRIDGFLDAIKFPYYLETHNVCALLGVALLLMIRFCYMPDCQVFRRQWNQKNQKAPLNIEQLLNRS